MAKKSFTEKLQSDQSPEVKATPKGKMLIPTPRLVDAEVRKVGKGKLLRQGQLRDRLAAQHRADYTCPLTTGIFLNIVAGAAEEARTAGKKQVTPYWRVIKDDGALCEKFPPGVAVQRRLLLAEGHRVGTSGRSKKLRVIEEDEEMQKLAARLRKKLQGKKGFEQKRMFGGECMMLRGHMLCGTAKGNLMLRVGPEAYEAALKKKHAREMDFTGKPLRGYVYVDPKGVRTDRALDQWLDIALRFNATLPEK